MREEEERREKRYRCIKDLSREKEGLRSGVEE